MTIDELGPEQKRRLAAPACGKNIQESQHDTTVPSVPELSYYQHLPKYKVDESCGILKRTLILPPTLRAPQKVLFFVGK